MPINTKKAQDNFQRYEYARDNGHVDYLNKAKMCEDFFQGLQWEESLRKTLERQGKPVMTINKILATTTTVMGEQLKNRADVTFKPFKNGNSDTSVALAKTYMQVTNANDYDALESEMFDDGVIGSRGYIDCRISFDDHMVGEVQYSLLNPRNVIPGSEAKSYDPDLWNEVFTTKWMTPNDIEENYNKKDADLLRKRKESVFDFGHDSVDDVQETFGGNEKDRYGEKPDDRKTFRVIERQYRKFQNVPHFVTETGDTRVVPQNWDEQRIAFAAQQFGWQVFTKRTSVIHWCVTVEDIVLHDKVSPYKHFTVIPYFPYFRRGKTIGLVESLISPQQILNKVASQELHVLNSSANGGWKIKKNSLSNMDVDELESKGATTGLVLELEETADAEKITPNQIPTGLDRVTFKMDEYIKDISGVSDSQRGLDRADVAAKAIQAKQAAGSVNLAKPLDNLVRTRKMVARNTLDLLQAYYTETRVLQITGSAPNAETEDVAINQMTPEGEVINDLTVGEYNVVVSSVPSHESYMESQAEEGLRLREAGVPITDEFLIENSTLAKKGELVQAMQDSGAQERSQQLEELDIQERQLSLEEKQFDMERKRQEADLAAARAEKTRVDASVAASGSQNEDPAFQVQLEAEKFAAEMALKEKQMLMEMSMKREQQREENLLKRAEMAERLEIERQKAKDQSDLQATQARHQADLNSQKAKQPTQANA